MGILQVEVTPIQHAEKVSRALGCDVFVKRDDLTHALYGGNKVRKLTHLLADAREEGATDLITIGAVGSHHALATTVHGRASGFDTHVVMLPQPFTPHVEETVRADLALGAELIPARGPWEVPVLVGLAMGRLKAKGRRPYLIAIGGSSPIGSVGYVDAVRELSEQISRGEMQSWPDAMVCALGSGGTYAGLLAGARAYGATSDIVGVQVTDAWMLWRPAVAWLASRAYALGATASDPTRGVFEASDVHVVKDQLGAGYGHPTAAAREAMALFAEDGLTLDLTYTAKAAAGLIAMARAGSKRRRYVFWHTLSSAPIEPLLGPQHDAIPARIDALMRGSRSSP